MQYVQNQIFIKNYKCTPAALRPPWPTPGGRPGWTDWPGPSVISVTLPFGTNTISLRHPLPRSRDVTTSHLRPTAETKVGTKSIDVLWVSAHGWWSIRLAALLVGGVRGADVSSWSFVLLRSSGLPRAQDGAAKRRRGEAGPSTWLPRTARNRPPWLRWRASCSRCDSTRKRRRLNSPLPLMRLWFGQTRPLLHTPQRDADFAAGRTRTEGAMPDLFQLRASCGARDVGVIATSVMRLLERLAAELARLELGR